MLRTLIAKEIHHNLLNLRFVIVYFVTTLLLVGSAAVSVSEYRTSMREYQLNKSLYDQDAARADGITSMWYGATVLRKPQLLGVFALGGERDPESKVVAGPRAMATFRAELKRSPLGNLYPPLDLSFIVGVVLSLLVILLTFDSIASEREQGTLKVMLAGPVARHAIILAKLLGGLISLALPFVASMLAVGLVLVAVPGMGIAGSSWAGIAAITGVFALYLVVVFSAATMVSVMVPRSGASALLLLLLWVLSVVLVPGVAGIAAYAVVKPVGVPVRQATALRQAISIHCRVNPVYDASVRQAHVKALGFYPYDPDSPRRVFTREQEAKIGELRNRFWIESHTIAMDSVLAQSQAELLDEQRVEQTASLFMRVSPFGCMLDACEAIAGTDLSRERRLRESLAQYVRSEWSTLVTLTAKYGSFESDMPHGSHPIYYPPAERPAGSALPAAALMDTGLLALAGLLCFLAAYRAFLRMDVT